MPILNTREDFMSRISTLVGDRNDDDTLAIIQDISDTYDNFSNTTALTQADIDNAVAETENAWRERYKNAFFSGTPEPLDNNPTSKPRVDPAKPDPSNPTSYDDIFK